MKIAILAWGSLIWAPNNLCFEGNWYPGGPELPLEFSRISGDGRLTLVIDTAHGVRVPTCYGISTIEDLDEARENLRQREKAQTLDVIHFVGLTASLKQGNEEICQIIEAWSKQKCFDAVIWTGLSSNFKEKQGKDFSVENAVEYLNTLCDEKLEKAREYIRKAPSQVMTPLRQKLKDIGWYKEGE